MNLFLTFFLVYLFSTGLTNDTLKDNKLKFKKDKEFTIMQWTDLHYCESEELDIKTQNLQEKLIELAKPDLIIITGDAISGFIAQGSAEGRDFNSCWEKFTSPMRKNKICYAYTFGESDISGTMTKSDIYELDKNNEHSLLQIQKKIGNNSVYRLEIESSYDVKSSANIWIFDSANTCSNKGDIWGCIGNDQITWFEETIDNDLNTEQNVDLNIAFMHSPIPEYLQLYNDYYFVGTKGEPISCSFGDVNFFEQVAFQYEFKAIFAGHDHQNDFGGNLLGIELVYGKKTGYGGNYYNSDEKVGARIIKLKEEIHGDDNIYVQMNHYLLLEDGTILNDQNFHLRNGEFQQQCSFITVLNSDNNGFTSWPLLIAFGLLAFFTIGVYVMYRLEILPKVFTVKASSLELESLKQNLEEGETKPETTEITKQ